MTSIFLNSYAAVPGANISTSCALQECLVPSVYAQYRLEGGSSEDWVPVKGRDSLSVHHSHTF